MLFPIQPVRRPARRVVVTGAGIISALGTGWIANAQGFRTGRVAFRPVTLFDASRQRCRLAGEVDLPSTTAFGNLSARQVRRLDRATRLLLHAALEAWAQARWPASASLPIILGTTSAGMPQGENYYRQAIRHPDQRLGQATRILQYQAQRQVLNLCEALDLRGPIQILSNACASGANAIGHAWDLIRSHRADRVLTGGYEGLCQLVFAGFDSLQALSTTCCRPFDVRRDGLILGEGAAILALESLDHARARHAPILGEITGYGASTDGHHLTQPHPQGDAALASMTAACTAADLDPTEVDYLNAHGTGTVLNDSSEAAAIGRWAGPRSASLPVSSTKAVVGHLLGAAGAVEAVVCLMALEGQWLPPTSTLETPDPCCTFPVVRAPANTSLRCVLSNSFGFGGANATLVFRGPP